MALLDLALVKKHLRVFFDDEDETIAAYQAAAENIVVEYLDRRVFANAAELPSGDDADQYDMVLTPAITAAILLTVGDLYERREADPTLEGNAVLPRPVRALLAPWRVWRTCTEDTNETSA